MNTPGTPPPSRAAGLPREVKTTVEIREVLSARTWRAVLPNGRLVLLYAGGRNGPPLHAGDKVPAALTPADFSVARLLRDS